MPQPTSFHKFCIKEQRHGQRGVSFGEQLVLVVENFGIN